MKGQYKGKQPAMMFYPGDWKRDTGVQALNYEERGIWFEMLLLMFESEQRGKLIINGKPISENHLCRLLNLDNQKLSKILDLLDDLGVYSRCTDSGAIMCRRMVRDAEISEVRRNAGKRGGNPNLLNQTSKQNPSKTEAKGIQTEKQNPTLSYSYSSSNSTPISPLPKGDKLPAVEKNFSKGFLSFWETYPLKKAKQEAWRIWKRKGLEAISEEINEGILRNMTSDSWKNNYIPHPSTFLNQGRWEDEITENDTKEQDLRQRRKLTSFDEDE